MKTILAKIVCLLVVAMPLQAEAQTNIQKAFDKLISSSSVKITESHSMEKDAHTGVKEAQSDVYNFTLLTDNFSLVKNIENAFRKDKDKAYTTSSGIADGSSEIVKLAVGDDRTSVRINPVGYHYVYSCFLAPKSEDPEGNYRYAYGMNWKEKGGKITGTLVKTYSTTLKYRQTHGRSSGSKLKYLNEYGPDSKQSWFGQFINYVQVIPTSNRQMRQALAAKIYEHTKDLKNVSEQDKTAAREILKTLISDMSKYRDNVSQQLLKSALANI